MCARILVQRIRTRTVSNGFGIVLRIVHYHYTVHVVGGAVACISGIVYAIRRALELDERLVVVGTGTVLPVTATQALAIPGEVVASNGPAGLYLVYVVVRELGEFDWTIAEEYVILEPALHLVDVIVLVGVYLYGTVVTRTGFDNRVLTDNILGGYKAPDELQHLFGRGVIRRPVETRNIVTVGKAVEHVPGPVRVRIYFGFIEPGSGNCGFSTEPYTALVHAQVGASDICTVELAVAYYQVL